MNYKLGRKYPTKAKLKLAKYLGPALPPPPSSVDWTKAMTQPWGAMLNAGAGAVGDCTAAGMGHAVQVITSNGDGLITPSDMSILQMYEVIGGYNPNDPNTDQGATELDAMRYMVDNGLAGFRADAFADVNQMDRVQVQQNISLFGGSYIGVKITQQDMDDFDANRAWESLDPDAGYLGGHAVWVAAYDSTGITIITWGKLQNATWSWFDAHCDEAHAVLIKNWYQNTLNCSPDGFNQAQLEADLKAL